MDNSVKLFNKTNSYLDMYDENGNLNATVNKGLKFIKNNDIFDVYKFRKNDNLMKLRKAEIENLLNSDNIVRDVHFTKEKSRYKEK